MTPQEFKTKRKHLIQEIQYHRHLAKKLSEEVRKLEELAFCPRDSTCQYSDMTHGCPRCHPTSFSNDKEVIKKLYESNWGSDWVDDGV